MTGAQNSSLTDLIRAVFHETIVPLAQSSQQYRLEFAPEPKNDSYFARPRRPVMSRADMEAMGQCGELEALAALWRAQGCDRLYELVPRLAEVSERLAAAHSGEDKTSETQDTPSTLIYQMY
jgi:hypothetical protein